MKWMLRGRAAAPASAVLAVAVLATLTATVGGNSAAATAAAPVIEVAESASIEIGTATSRSIPTSAEPPGIDEPMYVPEGLVTNVNWATEPATVPDRTTNPRANFVTPRTASMVDSAISAGLTRLGAVTCVAGRSQNPNSDHPGGRGCDLFYNPRSTTDVAAGWRTANWLVANQAELGVKYVIWQGMIWNARSRPGPWTTYRSSAYGCPNPANLTGCHYDHVHVSMY